MRTTDLNNELTVIEILAPAVKTASANGTGVDLQGYQGNLKLMLSSAAGTGTSPTMDVKIQDSADNSTFADVAGLTFAQVINAASLQSLAVDSRAVRRYIRAVETIGGTTPSFTRSLLAVGQKQIQ